MDAPAPRSGLAVLELLLALPDDMLDNIRDLRPPEYRPGLCDEDIDEADE